MDEALGIPGRSGRRRIRRRRRCRRSITATRSSTATWWWSARAPAAGRRRGALGGLDVVVVEAGGYWSEEDFDGAELSGYARMYLNGGGVATDDQSIGLLAGSCLGGGTVVNYTWCFRPPDFVREDWQGGSGCRTGRAVRRQPRRGLGPDRDQSESSIPSARDHAMRAGLEQRVGLAGDAAQLQGLRGGGAGCATTAARSGPSSRR